ncbi:MAG: right-handed parallel beta-helix repeat-containing protein [Verrucomicrobia bacterium]|nr:right-handed parallel beta-helix repeat-containing protein [Verrucomicrobiota bacterium]MBI3868242.1 right-handed parallel beta-helix repeat-containing protein [Verrucomicrobiota bacterium]
MKTLRLQTLALLSIALTLTSSRALAQGDLTPPGAPAPTMRTLLQIEPRTPIDSTHTPGDADSLFKITAPGSYYLTGNIVLSTRLGAVTKQVGIEVAASQVTIDLNGFRISGSGVAQSLSGISVSSTYKNVTVKNGTIAGWGAHGIKAAGVKCSSFQDLCLDSNDDTGLSAGDECVVRNCRAVSNGTNGIVVGSFCSIVDCQARSNPKVGISASTRSIISRCAVGDATSGDGIIADSFCSVDHCTVYNAYGWGIKTTQRPTISDCVVDSSGHPDQNGVSGGILLHFTGTVKHCVISFNLVGIEILGSSDGGGCVVLENEIDSNTGGGIDVLSGGNKIDGNTIGFNGGPAIRTHTAGNLIIRNHAVGNNGGASDYALGGNDTFGPIITGKGLIASSNPWANFQQ